MAHFQNNADFPFVLHLCVIYFLTEGSVRAKKQKTTPCSPQSIDTYSRVSLLTQQDSSSERERVWRSLCVGVKGLEADSAHKAHGDRVLYLHQDKSDITSFNRRGSCSKGNSTKRASGRFTRFKSRD